MHSRGRICGRNRTLRTKEPFHYESLTKPATVSRLELSPGLSLYEQLFLKKYMSPTAVQKVLVREANSAAVGRRKLLLSQCGGNTSSKGGELGSCGSVRAVDYPSLTHYLFANQNAHTPLAYCRPAPFDEGRTYVNHSERERFRRITSELAILREKMMATPDKGKILSLAVFCISC